MTNLYNTISRKILKENNKNKKKKYMIISFYKYFSIVNTTKFRNFIYKFFNNLNILGRIYISSEGINAQISVPEKNYKKMKYFLIKFNNNFKDIHFNHCIENKDNAFWLLSVKVRKKIVADNLYIPNLDYKKKGIYIDPIHVNKIIHEKNVIFIDIRNRYEYEVGHFIRSINFSCNTFREQLQELINYIQKLKKNKKIVMYCTGGIRCEKATSLLIHFGFKKIYQIQGGILNYVNKIRKKNLKSYFKGINFVFDARISEKITHDILGKCYNCGIAYNKYLNCKNSKCNLLFIQCISCNTNFNKYCSKKCMVENIL